MKTGSATLPLHYGKAPRWLFQRMILLAREIITVIIEEYGPEEVLRKLSDPYWFQAFGCVLGFDWHSSGLTTTACGAIKEGIKGREKELQFFAAGGKGGTSRKTPQEIQNSGNLLNIDPDLLVYSSKMSAKIDSCAVQDGYQLYHHCFFYTTSGKWAVVQQGMNNTNRYARRYHWLSEGVKDFVCEPHSAICCDKKDETLNLVAKDSSESRKTITEISHEKPEVLIKNIKTIQNSLHLPAHHAVTAREINPDRLYKIFLSTYENNVPDFKALLNIKGVGPKTIRALSLISELIYGAKPSFEDPVRFSYSHGGKDGHPYPVDRKNYDNSIKFLKTVLSEARIGNKEKIDTFRRLNKVAGSASS